MATDVSNKFDVIVVGAGLAGLAAAHTCAQAGLETIVIERGTKPGTKNVMGGVLYTRPTAKVFPEFWKDAPVERPVIEQGAWLLTSDSAIKLAYRSQRFADDPPNAFTVLRVKLDKYFADQAEKSGALVICETLVEEVLTDGDNVIGVRCGRAEGDLYAPVVIIAEGVNSELTRQLGMQTDLKLDDTASVVKELIRLDPKVIEDRFNLSGEHEGATIEMYGDATLGMLGTAFLYTNKDSISLGVGFLLSQAVEAAQTPYDMLQRLKQHSMVAPLIEGGETGEYMTHMIPEGGYNRMPQLFGHGVMVVGDAAMLVNGIHREGSNYALLSGQLAAETAIEAHENGDFSGKTLSHYRARLLDETPILRDLRKYRNAAHYVESHPALLSTYPDLVSDAMYEMLNVDDVPKRQKQWEIVRMVLRARSLVGMAWDGIDGARSML